MTFLAKKLRILMLLYEPRHDKPNRMAVRPAKTQPGHQPCVISVFAVCMKNAWVLTLSAQRRLIRLGGCLGWSESSLGTHSFVGFVMSWLIFSKPFILAYLKEESTECVREVTALATQCDTLPSLSYAAYAVGFKVVTVIYVVLYFPWEF